MIPPSQEVQRQACIPDHERLNPHLMVVMALGIALASAAGASVIAKAIANTAHFNATYIDQGAF
jgi:hypothetical protein